MKRLPKFGRKSKSRSKDSDDDAQNNFGIAKPAIGTSLDDSNDISDSLPETFTSDGWKNDSTSTLDRHDDEDDEPKQEIFMGLRRGGGTIDKIAAQMKELHVKAGTAPATQPSKRKMNLIKENRTHEVGGDDTLPPYFPSPIAMRNSSHWRCSGTSFSLTPFPMTISFASEK